MLRNRPPPARPGGRSSTACHRCHSRKVKCSREIPCRNCHLANRDCTYPVRDQVVAVPESYIRSLEAKAFGRLAGPMTHSLVESPGTSITGAHPDITGSTSNPHSEPAPLVDDPTTEVFVSRLKRFQHPYPSHDPLDYTNANSLLSPTQVGEAEPQNSPYEYFRLNFDTKNPSLSFKLPPYPYALVLLDQFDVFLGHDWHWFLRKTFRDRMELTYKRPSSSEATDRTWLCRLLVVFALGESFNLNQTPEIHFNLEMHSNSRYQPSKTLMPPPGTEFFEQALALLNIRYEDPTLDQIEALNLIAFYSYSLNRKKAAYAYAGLSARLSHILGLHKPPTSPIPSIVTSEHRKRIWWTTYCLDRMTSTEMGLPTAFRFSEIELPYPDDSVLVFPDHRAEFHDAHILTAHIQLAFIHADICENMKSLREDSTADVGRWTRPIVQRLNDLKAGLPPHMSYDFEDGIPAPVKQMSDRSLPSLYQRYNQCFILLLRPLFIKRVGYLLSSKVVEAEEKDLREFTNICLQRARSNLNIIIDLWKTDRMTRFGFWESLHLFSGLMILSLANSVNSHWPGSFDNRPSDACTYDMAKQLLDEMVRAGNLASKGQEYMLQEVEAFRDVCLRTTNENHDAYDVDHPWNVDDWMNYMLDAVIS